MIPILRQLAFREICIAKARTKGLSLTSSPDDWAKTLLDEKSYNNLKASEHTKKFTRKDLFEGKTGNDRLDNEIKLCKESRWMPNRARMWFAGEVYWGCGGGIKSLEILVDFFNTFCDDAQSPNNWVSCVESMRMQYGKVMRFNEKRTFRLLSGEERRKFEVSEPVELVRREMSEYLGLQPILTLEELDLLYVTCNFDLAWRSGPGPL